MAPKKTAPPPLDVEPAPPERQAAAFRLVFQDVDAAERDVRVVNALRMVRSAELDPDGVLAARRGSRLLGALVCLPTPGASGLVWPPRTLDVPDREAVEDALLQHAAAWLQRRGVRLGQALLTAEEARFGPALERNGFKHITDLRYLHHLLDLTPAAVNVPERLTYRTVDECDHAVFVSTLRLTYEGTLDCPEVAGARTVEETLEGHRAQGRYDPKRWWLASEGERPVGVLLLAEMPEWEAWDLSYVGLVPDSRGRGYGVELVRRALRTAWEHSAGQMTVSVDERNVPAVRLYEKMGFQTFDRRSVYLAFWSPRPNS
jgi:mycothiol synthase